MGQIRSQVGTIRNRHHPALVKCSLYYLGPVPIVMSHLSPNEVESLVEEANEAAGVGRDHSGGGGAAPTDKPAQENPRAKRAKCAFAGDVDMPKRSTSLMSNGHSGGTTWRPPSVPFGDDLAAKKAGDYHVEPMNRGLDQAGVDMATESTAPSSEPREALLMMALYENHAQWRLDVIAGQWRSHGPPH